METLFASISSYPSLAPNLPGHYIFFLPLLMHYASSIQPLDSQSLLALSKARSNLLNDLT